MSKSVFMRLTKQGIERTVRAECKPQPWRHMKPLLGTLAVAAVLAAPLPAKPDTPAQAKTSVTAQAKASKQLEDRKVRGFYALMLVVAAEGVFFLAFARDSVVHQSDKKSPTN
jgi:hypothetical protein